MENMIMISIGVIFILISIIFLSSYGKKERAIYQDIIEKYNDIKEYSDTIEQIVDNLDKLIDSFLTRYDNNVKNNFKSGQIIDYMVSDSQINNPYVVSNDEKNTQNNENTKDIKTTQKEIDELEVKDISHTINELKNQGLSNQEIAKKLGKGIREIDIITKINKLKN